jgi:hypothetical protein
LLKGPGFGPDQHAAPLINTNDSPTHV